MNRRMQAVALSAAIMAIGLGPLAAQTYPVKTVTLVTHSSPGGGSDVFLRELAKYLAPELGVDVVVDNVSGGSGAKAMAHMAAQPADGSVFYATTPTFIYTSLLSKPDKTYKDLEPLVNVFEDPEVIYTAASSPVQTIEDAIKGAKEQRVSWGAANPNSLERQALEQLKKVAGVDVGIVSYEGGGDMMLNVLNGTLQIGVGEIQEIRSQLDSGEVRLVASLGDERLANYPDVPTAKESGYDVSVRKFRGLAGPKGLPADVIAIWEKAIPALLENPEYKKAYSEASLLPDFVPHAEYGPFIDTFAAETESYLKEAGITEQ